MVIPNIIYESTLFEISFVDFLIIFGVEIIFFSFVSGKQTLKQNWIVILLSALLKVGLLSLLITWIPYYIVNSLQSVVFFTVLLFLSGSFITTFILERELVMPRNVAFNLGFQLSLLSSAMFFAIKVLLIPYIYSYPILTMNYYDSGISRTGDIAQTLVNFGSGSGLFFLLFGIVGVIYFSRNKNKAFSKTS